MVLDRLYISPATSATEKSVAVAVLPVTDAMPDDHTLHPHEWTIAWKNVRSQSLINMFSGHHATKDGDLV